MFPMPRRFSSSFQFLALVLLVSVVVAALPFTAAQTPAAGGNSSLGPSIINNVNDETAGVFLTVFFVLLATGMLLGFYINHAYNFYYLSESGALIL